MPRRTRDANEVSWSPYVSARQAATALRNGTRICQDVHSDDASSWLTAKRHDGAFVVRGHACAWVREDPTEPFQPVIADEGEVLATCASAEEAVAVGDPKRWTPDGHTWAVHSFD